MADAESVDDADAIEMRARGQRLAQVAQNTGASGGGVDAAVTVGADINGAVVGGVVELAGAADEVG